jgi:flagellin-like protein
MNESVTKRMNKKRSGLTGLETAIILIAFVIVASAL